MPLPKIRRAASLLGLTCSGETLDDHKFYFFMGLRSVTEPTAFGAQKHSHNRLVRNSSLVRTCFVFCSGDASMLLKSMFKPRYFSTAMRKLVQRLHPATYLTDRDNLNWLHSVKSSLSEFCQSLDPALWDEAVAFSNTLEERAEKKLSTISFDLGGGGCYPLIYFLVRMAEPERVLETGVAAGFSSEAVLSALEINQKGKLHSSDFPYLRLEDAEKYVGFVVSGNLKYRWTLYLEGDRKNIPVILNNLGTVDFFHFDSDKSYGGRDFAYKTVEPYLTEDAIVVFDDIQDNAHFKDIVARETKRAWRVFEFNGKFLGLLYSQDSVCIQNQGTRA